MFTITKGCSLNVNPLLDDISLLSKTSPSSSSPLSFYNLTVPLIFNTFEPLTSTPLVRLRGSREPLHDSRIRNCRDDNRSHCLSANNFLDPTRLSLKSVTYNSRQPSESQFILPLLADGCNRPSNLSGAQQTRIKALFFSLTPSLPLRPCTLRDTKKAFYAFQRAPIN